MYPDQPDNSKQKKIAAFAVIIIAGIIIAAAVAFGNRQDAPQSTATTSQQSQAATDPATTPDNTSDTTVATAYNDGTYTADSDYNVPRSFENIKVTLTVANNVVTDSQIVNSEGDRESAEWQEKFTSVYKAQVVGKKLSDINLYHVAGASDTAEGFNNALEQIKNQAKS